MHGVIPSPFVPSVSHSQAHEPIAQLRTQIEDYESKKGFHTTGTPVLRTELETLFKSAISFKGHPSFVAEVRPLIFNIARLYAMTHYNDGGFVNSKTLTMFAVNNLLSLVALEYLQSVSPEVFPSLKGWETICLQEGMKGHIEVLEKHLVSLSLDSLVVMTHGNVELQWMLASGMRWLGHSLQNSPGYGPSEHSDKLFDQVYGGCGALLRDINNARSETEYVELIYNTILFLHTRKHPGDLDGAYKRFQDEVLVKYRSAALEARVANLFSAQYSGQNELEKAFTLNNVAAEIYGTKPDIVSPFTRVNTFCNNAKLRMSLVQQSPFKYGDDFKLQIPKYFGIAAKYIAEEPANSTENTYFSIWELNMAQWDALSGDKAGAIAKTELIVLRLSGMLGKWSDAQSILTSALGLLVALKKP